MAVSPLTAPIEDLLAATEALGRALSQGFPQESDEQALATEDGVVVELRAAYSRREAAFEALQSGIRRGHSPDAAGRAMLGRIRVLDQDLIDASRALFGEVRDARRDLSRRRSAVAAHQSRERGAPRFVAVKA